MYACFIRYELFYCKRQGYNLELGPETLKSCVICINRKLLVPAINQSTNQSIIITTPQYLAAADVFLFVDINCTPYFHISCTFKFKYNASLCSSPFQSTGIPIFSARLRMIHSVGTCMWNHYCCVKVCCMLHQSTEGFILM